MKNLKRIFLVFALICGVVSSTSAQSALEGGGYSSPKESTDITTLSVGELWNRANTAYANENYLSAKRMYKEILSRGVESADIYYNLGNVNYKRGQIGASLLNYYKAQRLKPMDDDISHNIEVVSLSVQDNITPMPRLFLLNWNDRIASVFNCEGWSVVSLVAFGLLLAAVLCYLLASRLSVRRIGFVGGAAMLVLFVVSTCYALGARADILNPSQAIVTTSSLSVTSAPSRSSTELFILHEGTKVRVDTSVDGWSQIVLDDGKKGWVPQDKIVVI